MIMKTHIEAKQARRVEGPCYWLLYDGQCPLCQCTVEWVRRLDTRRLILPLDLHSQWQQISQRAPNLTQEDLIESVHLIAPDGRVWSGFEASRKLATLLPLLWPAVPWLYVPGASRCGDRMYRLISRHRHWLAPRSCEEGVCGLDKQ
jgi:predicted DCC family thiol-disulfide oxidoreductase YuxK